MRSSLIIAVKKIKKRKLQNFLIGIIIASSALLFSTAVGVMISFNSPIDKMFKSSNSSHDLFMFNDKYYDKCKIKNWFESQKEVSKVQLYNIKNLDSDIKINNKKVSFQMNFLSEVPENKGDIDNFEIVKGKKKSSPGNGEVWVNTGFADVNNVKIGDILSIDGRDYKVSAVLVDTQFSSIMMGIQRYWVKEGEIQNFNKYKGISESAISIRYKNPSSSENVWYRFQRHFTGPILGSKVEYKSIYQCYSTVLKYTGVFMLFFSIIIIITAVLIIKFVISNSIYRDYKNIGIYKALGFSQASISLIYVIQYFIITLISTAAGIILSKFAIDKMMDSTLKTIGMESLKISYAVPFISTFIVMTAFITLSSFLSTLKTSKIKPVQAIKECGLSKSSFNTGEFQRRMFQKFPLTFAMSLKSIINNKKSVLLIFISIFITLYASLSGVNLLNTTDSIGRNMGYWGFDNSMVDLKLNLRSYSFLNDVKKELKENNDVKCFSTFYFYDGTSIKNKKGNIEKVQVSQVLGDDAGKLGFMEMEGRNPEKSDEISLSVNTARAQDKHVGDYMEVYINNKKLSLMVVGIYQSLNGMGKGMRFYEDTVKNADPDYVPGILINVKDKNDINSFINKEKEKYGKNIDIVKRQGEFDDQMKQMTGDSFIAVFMIIAIMLSICLLNVFNITLMNINENKKSFGIYKAIGMTSKNIQCSIILKFILIFAAALIFALPFAIKVTPLLMSFIFINVGIAKYPVSITIPYMSLITAICFLFIILSAFLASKIINKIKLRSLIEE